MSDNNQIPNNPMENEVPTFEKTGFEVPPQPSQFTQPEFEQPIYSQPQYNQQQFQQPYQYNNSNNPTPKKKGNKKVVGLIAAFVGVAACVAVAVFAGPKIVEALSKGSSKDAAARFKNAITATTNKVDETLEESSSFANIKGDNVKVDVKFDVTVGDYVINYLPQEYQQIASLKNIGGNMSLISKDKNMYANIALDTNDKALGSVEAFIDQNSYMGYFKVPELSPAYVSSKLDENMFASFSELYSQMSAQAALQSNMSIDPSAFADLVSKETDVILKSIGDVEVEKNVKVEAGGVTAKYDKLTASIKGQELVDLLYDVVKVMAEDNNISNIMQQAMYSSGTYMSFDDILQQIKTVKARSDEQLIINLYLDDNDKITGITFVAEGGKDKFEIAILSAKDKKSGFEFYVKENKDNLFRLYGSYTNDSNVYSGKATLEVENAAMAELTFENVSSSKDKFKGTFSFTSPQLMGSVIKMDIDCEKQHMYLALDVSMAATSAFSASLDITVSEPDSCPTVPADAVVYDANTQQEDYMNSADYIGFLQNIQAITGIDLMSELNGGF